MEKADKGKVLKDELRINDVLYLAIWFQLVNWIVTMMRIDEVNPPIFGDITGSSVIICVIIRPLLWYYPLLSFHATTGTCCTEHFEGSYGIFQVELYLKMLILIVFCCFAIGYRLSFISS